MSRRLCRLTLAGALVSSGCLSSALPQPYPLPSAPAMALPERVTVRTGGRVAPVALEDYVVAAALSEVTPVGDSADVVDRVYAVQAVVARTYAVAHLGRHRAEGFDFCDSTHCQLYQPARRQTSRFASAAEAAASRTRGQILTFDGRAADTLFHADCGGRTAAASAVWGGAPVAYLQAIVDDVPEGAHRGWRVAVSADELRAALNADPRTAVGKSLSAIDVDHARRFRPCGSRERPRRTFVRRQRRCASHGAQSNTRRARASEHPVLRDQAGRRVRVRGCRVRTWRRPLPARGHGARPPRRDDAGNPGHLLPWCKVHRT